MAELPSDLAGEITAACTANAVEIAGAIARALDVPAESALAITAAPMGALQRSAMPADLSGPGLAIVFKFGDTGALALLSESSGLLPEWYASPDATGLSKLGTLAQELSFLLVPATMMADDCRAARVGSLAAAIERAGIADGAELVPLTLTAGDKQGTLHFVWRCSSAEAVYAGDSKPAAAQVPATAKDAKRATGAKVLDVDGLPSYSRSLLKIRVPVIVQLATKKQSIEQIVELGAGSIIKFEKSCDEMLELEIGGSTIARGEAVKVGDKFGLRIHSMVLPGERFQKVERK